MPTVWWMGRGSSNTIRTEDWAAHDIVAGPVVWDALNAWSVDEAELTSEQIAVLAADKDYLTGQTGPRQFPSPPTGGNFEDFVRSAYAYFIAIKAMYDAWLAGGGGGPGGGPENTDELDEGSTNLYFTDARADARADIRAAAAISNLIGAAPAELDTWIELVSQISSNEDAIAGIVSSISGKQDADADLTWLAGNLSAFARTLLDDPDAATALATLGAVARTATASRIYGTDASGLQTLLQYLAGGTSTGTVPIRDAGGTFQVGAPTHVSHPARKTDLDAVGKVLSRVDYTGGPSTVQYFEIGRLPIDNSGNSASIMLGGRLGGWTQAQFCSWSITLMNRTVGYTGDTITASVIAQGIPSVALQTADIEVYSQADKSAIVYLKATGYYAMDLRGSGAGYGGVVGTVGLVTTPATPVGTKIWALSTAPRLEIGADGRMNISSFPVPGNSRVYIVNGSGVQDSAVYSSLLINSSFPLRDANGTFEVGAPTSNNHPSRKIDLDGKLNSPTGTPDGHKFLGDDNTWRTPPGTAPIVFNEVAGTWPPRPDVAYPVFWLGGDAPDDAPPALSANDVWIPKTGDNVDLGQIVESLQALAGTAGNIPYFASTGVFGELVRKTVIDSLSDTELPTVKAVKTYVDKIPIARTVTASGDLAAGDRFKYVEVDSASGVTLTLPSGILDQDEWIAIRSINTGIVTIAGTGVVAPGGRLKLAGQWSDGMLVCRTPGGYVFTGDATT